jgi:hypothetical protein
MVTMHRRGRTLNGVPAATDRVQRPERDPVSGETNATMNQPYQPPATDPSREEATPSIRKRRAGPVARFQSAATILIAIALIIAFRRYATSGLVQLDTFPVAAPRFVRALVLDYPYAAPCLAILLAVIGGAMSFSRRVFLSVAVTSAAAALLAAWTGILLWVLMDLIKGVTG